MTDNSTKQIKIILDVSEFDADATELDDIYFEITDQTDPDNIIYDTHSDPDLLFSELYNSKGTSTTLDVTELNNLNAKSIQLQ